jgi:hypothetical protein
MDGSVFLVRLRRWYFRPDLVVEGQLAPGGVGPADIAVRVRFPWWWPALWRVFILVTGFVAFTDPQATMSNILEVPLVLAMLVISRERRRTQR